MLSLGNALSVASKMKFVPMFSWHAPIIGWKLLNEPRKPNKLSPPRPTNPPFLLTLNPPIFLLLQLPSRSRNSPQLKWMNINSMVFVIILKTNIFLGHKCKEQNIFMAMTEDLSEEDVVVSLLITWKISSKKVIHELYPNSTPFMLMRHLLCILTSNLSSPATKLFLPPPKKFPLLMASMIIPSLSSQAVFLPMFSLIVIPLPRRIKLRKLFMNY
jgi:hypothetical protein